MERKKFKNFVKEYEKWKKEVINGEKEYITLMKTLGKSYKYPFKTQFCIALDNPNATACATFDFWSKKAMRQIKKGEKGIRVMGENNKDGSYLFDIEQTEATLFTKENFVPFSLNEKDEDILMKVLDNHFIISTEIPNGNYSQKLDKLIEERVDKNYIDFYNRVSSDEKINSKNLINFINESLKISVYSRLNLTREINLKAVNLKKEFIKDNESLKIFGNEISKLNYLILNDLIRDLEKEKKRGGIENERERSTSRSGILLGNDRRNKSLYSDKSKDDVGRGGNAIYGSNNATKSNDTNAVLRRNDRGYKNDEIGNTRQLEETTTKMGESQSEVYGRVSTGETRLPIQESDRGRISTGNSQESEEVLRGLHRYEQEELWTNRGIESEKSNGMGRTIQQSNDDSRGNDTERDNLSRQLENKKNENLFYPGQKVRYKNSLYEITSISFDETFGNLVDLKGLEPSNIGGKLPIFRKETLMLKNINELESIFEIVEEKKEIENNITENISPTPLSTNEKVIKEIKGKNFKITDDFIPEKLLPSERLENNINAIKTLKILENEKRNATEEEQEILAKYVGWGGLSDVFDENKLGQWENARNYLKENLSNLEFEKARESTLTAFYTPSEIIDSIYKTLNNLGFEDGNILEPSCGVGNFISRLPEKNEKSSVYGVELDSISAQISKYLYPESKIVNKGYEKTNFPDNFFDVAIGNIPFGDFSINDSRYNKNNFLIHDYFFAKTIDKVRPNGVIAFVTSAGTLDKENDVVRKYLSENVNF